MWKILLAALLALIAIVLIIGGRFDLAQLQTLRLPWLAGPTKAIELALWPANFTFSPTTPLNLVVGNMSLSNFTGTIYSDFIAARVTFRPTGSQTEFTIPLTEIELGAANLTRLEFSNTQLVMKDLTVTGDIEIDGFAGTVAIINASLRLAGNVTRLVIKTDNTVWELK